MKTELRPRIRPEKTPIDGLLIIAAWAVLLMQWGFLFWHYSTLPSDIPMHFNIKGEVDRYDSKLSLLFLPILSTLLIIGLSILNRYPHIFNYPVRITEENALQQYRLATRLLRFLNLFISVLLAAITISIINFAVSKGGIIGLWFIPLLSVFSFVPLIIYLIASSKQK